MKCLKIINAILANIYQYKNLGRKICRCIASMYFNQECSLNNIIPSYFKIKIPKTSPVSKHYILCLTDSCVIFVIKNTMGMNRLQIMPYRRQTVVTSASASLNT
jgi:hypothetical protein